MLRWINGTSEFNFKDKSFINLLSRKQEKTWKKNWKKIVAKISPKIAKTIAELHQGVCVSVRNARSYQIGSYAWMDVEIIV